jgi:hypothetical protein
MRIISTLSADKTKRIAAVDRSLLEPIGELTVNFALVERTLKDGIARLLFPAGDKGWSVVTSSIVTSEMSFRRLVDLFHCLVLHRCSEADAERSKALCVRLFQLEERRNAIMHSDWVIDHNAKVTIRIKVTAKSKGLRRHEEAMSRENVQEIADNLAVLTKDLDDFISDDA